MMLEPLTRFFAQRCAPNGAAGKAGAPLTLSGGRNGPAGESSKTGSIGEAGEVGEAGTACCAAGTGAGGSSLPTFLEPIRFSAVLDKHLT